MPAERLPMRHLRVEADAHAAVLAGPVHQALRAALAHSAAAVYRDPAAATARVEQAVHGGQDPFELGGILRDDPGAVGELRGSGRLWDGLKARGERQAALAAARRFAADAQDLGHSYRTGVSAAVEAETARRQRLSVAVPSLSPAALTRLRQLEAVRRADRAGYSTGVAQLMAMPAFRRRSRRSPGRSSGALAGTTSRVGSPARSARLWRAIRRGWRTSARRLRRCSGLRGSRPMCAACRSTARAAAG